jgi:hypothetical protein
MDLQLAEIAQAVDKTSQAELFEIDAAGGCHLFCRGLCKCGTDLDVGAASAALTPISEPPPP